jgi:hypothetical protein
VKFMGFDCVSWPEAMNTSESGLFRVVEYKTLLEWTFTPQWRTGRAGSNWQDFKQRNPSKPKGVEAISFKTKEEAEKFIDDAVVYQPVLQIHGYQPNVESDWGAPE